MLDMLQAVGPRLEPEVEEDCRAIRQSYGNKPRGGRQVSQIGSEQVCITLRQLQATW